MRANFKKIFILSGLFLAITQSFLFSQIPAKDQIIDTVKCRNDKKQSYALYLPAQYDSKKNWPVILIFDPVARGTVGVKTFVEAAGKYGFILACSNNSRNGPMPDNFNAAAAMLGDVEDRFTIDQRRIYLSGFSGGSRFATAFAVKEKKISGIIGCGAGLPNDRNFLPTAVSDFLYYGTSGNRDMNYPEMNDLGVFFNNRTRVTFFLRTFAGGHQWPDPVIIYEAVEWLVIQGMNRKLIPADENFLSNAQSKTEALIQSQISEGNTIDAVRYLQCAKRDFAGTPFASKMSLKLSDLEKSSEYKSAIRKWNKMSVDEQESKEKYMNYIGELINSGSFPDSASIWWKRETGELTRLRDKGKAENSQMASRLLNFISIMCSEQGTSYYRNKSYEEAVFLFKICTLSDSENPANYYNLSRSLAGEGKPREALSALSGAISHGFNAKKSVESDPVFGLVRSDARYKELISKMK